MSRADLVRKGTAAAASGGAKNGGASAGTQAAGRAPGPGTAPATDLPGEPPYLRGIHPTMYRSRLWTMRQYAGFGDATSSNRRYHYLLSLGQTGLSVAFDLPTQMGYDADHPRARGEVGRSGVAISTIEDMERLLQGIPLDRVSLSMTINATA